MVRSVKANLIFNLINSTTQLLFPLITFPYASRIMMADGIGQVNFFQSIVNYISLFTCLGIPMYAIREIATVRENPIKMNKVTFEILSLHGILTIFGYIVVGVICLTVPQVQVDVPLFLVLSIGIFFTAIGCDWFYQGIEDFKYVAIRGLIFKIVSIAFLFLFVKTRNDLLLYGVYTILGSVGGNIFNFFRLRKYLNRSLVKFISLRPFQHLKPALHVFAFNVIISIYLQLNVVLLGFFKDAEAVGYFTTATKLLAITMSLSSALGAVMMSRSSNLIAEGRMDEFKTLIQKSYDFVLALTIPLTIGLIFTSKSAILLLSGANFIPSILASKIVAPNILLVGISGVLGIQILYPMGKINKVIICSLFGAATNVLLNILFIPYFGHYGTAAAYLSAEIVVTSVMMVIARKDIPLRYFKKQHINYLCAGGVMAFVLSGIYSLYLDNVSTIIAMITSGIISYFATLFVLRDYWSMSCYNMVVNRIRRIFRRN